MVELFIAEKRSVALAIATALSSNFTEKEGYIESNDGKRLYSFASGHLLTLREPAEMNEEWKEWKWETLPIIPQSIQLKVIGPRQRKQLDVIKKLTERCDRIINSCDCARRR